MAGTAAAVGGAALSGVEIPGTTNMLAFTSRSAMSLARSVLVEDFRQKWKALLGRETTTADYRIAQGQINELADQIVRHQDALHLSDMKVLRCLSAIKQFEVNYSKIIEEIIGNGKLSPENGITAAHTHHKLVAAQNRLTSALAAELVFQPDSIGQMDARSSLGKVVDWGTLATLIYNDTNSLNYFLSGDYDLSTPAGQADFWFKLTFGIGNSLLTGHTISSIAGGSQGVSMQEQPFMQKLRAAYSTFFTAGAAAWTVTDVMTHFGPLLENMATTGGPGGEIATAILGLGKVALDGGLTYAMYKQADIEISKALKKPMPEPRQKFEVAAAMAIALMARTALGAYEEYHKEDYDLPTQEEFATQGDVEDSKWAKLSNAILAAQLAAKVEEATKAQTKTEENEEDKAKKE